MGIICDAHVCEEFNKICKIKSAKMTNVCSTNDYEIGSTIK